MRTVLRKVVRGSIQGVMALCCALALTLGGVMVTSGAIASPMQGYSQQSQSYAYNSENNYGNNLKQQAKGTIDKAAGYGTSDQLEGQAKETMGRVQRNFGKTSGQVEGATQQAEGRAKRDIGRTKNAIQDAGDQTGEATQTVLDNVKDFFGQ